MTREQALTQLAPFVTQDEFRQILAIAIKKPTPVAVKPSIKFLDVDGNPFPAGVSVDHKEARRGRTVITAPQGSFVGCIPYKNGAPTAPVVVGQFEIGSDGTSVLTGVQFNYPAPGELPATYGVKYFYGPRTGTNWQPINTDVFEIEMFNYDIYGPIATGAPQT